MHGIRGNFWGLHIVFSLKIYLWIVILLFVSFVFKLYYDAHHPCSSTSINHNTINVLLFSVTLRSTPPVSFKGFFLIALRADDIERSAGTFRVSHVSILKFTLNLTLKTTINLLCGGIRLLVTLRSTHRLGRRCDINSLRVGMQIVFIQLWWYMLMNSSMWRVVEVKSKFDTGDLDL